MKGGENVEQRLAKDEDGHRDRNDIAHNAQCKIGVHQNPAEFLFECAPVIITIIGSISIAVSTTIIDFGFVVISVLCFYLFRTLPIRE